MAILGRWRIKQTFISLIVIALIIYIACIQLDFKKKYVDSIKKMKDQASQATTVLLQRAKTQIIENTGLASLRKLSSARGVLRKQHVINLFVAGQAHSHCCCQGRVEIFNQVGVLFRNITLDPQYSHVKATGGIDPANIRQQSETDEEYRFDKGFFTLFCPETVQLDSKALFASGGAKHLKDYIKSTSILTDPSILDTNLDQGVAIDKKFTIVLMRYEYANVYWTLMDLYDVYLTMRFCNETAGNTQVLLTDARPKGHLDALWKIFGSVKMLQEIESKILFPKLSWRYSREYSPLLQKQAHSIPELQEFRHFVLQSLGISVNKKRDCEKLTVLYIWRRDYVAHPRNPSGLVWRKIRNEEQLLKETIREFPTFRVRGVQLDKLNVTEQLKLLSQADVIIGMHGAAMSFSLFLPPKSAVIELYPLYYKGTNWHMEMAAKWSGHLFFEWHNANSKLEDDKLKYTKIPTNIPTDFIKKAQNGIC